MKSVDCDIKIQDFFSITIDPQIHNNDDDDDVNVETK